MSKSTSTTNYPTPESVAGYFGSDFYVFYRHGVWCLYDCRRFIVARRTLSELQEAGDDFFTR